ncbi:MAG: methionine synthase [Prevotellaceae bacterium]|jgi:hypothetical protein|nr:methionine synthase [Prevotellaceae bacterium]
MTHCELSIAELALSPSDLYREMGYGNQTPDAGVVREVEALLAQVARIARPRYAFVVSEVDLLAGGYFNVGKLIRSQLGGAEAFALFVATAGVEFEAFVQTVKQQGDMVQNYLLDAVGSVVAEKTADRMEEALQASLEPRGWHHTNRFSPGYCGWSVAEQHQLFRLFPTPAPCGIRLMESGLMIPLKSVSGILGVGARVQKRDYACRFCRQPNCFRRKEQA